MSIKGKSKTTKKRTCWLFTKNRYQLKEGIGSMFNQGNILSEYEVSKKVISLLRDSQQVHREEDGAVHFCRIKENLLGQFPQIPHWSDDRWKSCLAAEGGVKRRFQYCTDDSGTNVYFRALQGHSGSNLIDPLLQDNVKIQSGFFHHIYHIGFCVESSFYHQQWIDTWRSEFEQETNSILLAY